MADQKWVNLQFGGVIKAEVAEQVIAIFESAIKDRMPNTGSVLRYREVALQDDADKKNPELVFTREELLESLNQHDS